MLKKKVSYFYLFICIHIIIRFIEMSNLEKEYATNSVLHNHSWYNDVADKLLSENFYLTALEFYAELTECGKELPKLKDFFSNPLNFEQGSLSKHEIIQSENLRTFFVFFVYVYVIKNAR